MKTRILMFALISGATLFSSPTIFAKGGNGSHGGNAVVCFSDASIVQEMMRRPEGERTVPNSALSKITLVRMLDLFSIVNQTGLDIIEQGSVPLFTPRTGEANSAYIERLARRFDEHSPRFSEILRTGFEEFEGKVSLRGSDDGLAGVSQVVDYKDLRFQIDRKKCVIATLASQNGDGDLEIDSRLYNHPKHSEMSRKALVVHEVFFRHSIKNDGYDADPIRELTAAALQKQISREKLISLYQNTFPREDLSESLRTETIGLIAKVEAVFKLHNSENRILHEAEIAAKFEDEKVLKPNDRCGTFKGHYNYAFDTFMNLINEAESDVKEGRQRGKKHDAAVARLEALRAHLNAAEARKLRDATEMKVFREKRLKEYRVASAEVLSKFEQIYDQAGCAVRLDRKKVQHFVARPGAFYGNPSPMKAVFDEGLLPACDFTL